MTTLLIVILLVFLLTVVAAREVRRDGLGSRRPPRGAGDDWMAGTLPSHPYGI